MIMIRSTNQVPSPSLMMIHLRFSRKRYQTHYQTIRLQHTATGSTSDARLRALETTSTVLANKRPSCIDNEDAGLPPEASHATRVARIQMIQTGADDLLPPQLEE